MLGNSGCAALVESALPPSAALSLYLGVAFTPPAPTALLAMALPSAESSFNGTATGCMLALSTDPISNFLVGDGGAGAWGGEKAGPVFITPLRLGLAAAVILVNGLVSVWLRLAMHKKLAVATIRCGRARVGKTEGVRGKRARWCADPSICRVTGPSPAASGACL